jgi:hypothetical protein
VSGSGKDRGDQQVKAPKISFLHDSQFRDIRTWDYRVILQVT